TLSTILYGSRPVAAGDLIAAAWMVAALTAVVVAGLAVAPAPWWTQLVRTTRRLWVPAASASIAACVAGALSWRLWNPASQLTYFLVKLILHPFVAEMVVQPAVMRIGTGRFTAIISP